MHLPFIAAYLGGLLTILAPCGATLLPAFFAYAFSTPRAMARQSLYFLAGLLVSLVPLGFAASALSAFLFANKQTITVAVGIFVAVLGLWQIFALPSPHFVRLSRLPLPASSGRQSKSEVAFATFLLGVTFGLAGVGCSGPILGSVLGLSLVTGKSLLGGLAMALYAFGMFTPVAVLATLWNQLDLGKKRWLRPRPTKFLGRKTTVGNLLGGGIFFVLGIVLVAFGTPGSLPILSTASFQNIEQQFINLGSQIPNWLTLVGVVALAAFIGLLLQRRK
ncbi:MAG: cytochrome c biogenesis CcdA family protein [Actinomycetaceae bacterium]|nr:cytochrome c biogenesis CcdA family protein [Actinomycetaceae bacterium]